MHATGVSKKPQTFVSTFWTLYTMAMAAYLDFAVGALLAISIALVYGATLPLELLLRGSFWALIPDILDIVWFALAMFGKEKGDHHDRLSHSPIAIVPAAILIELLWHGPMWATIAGMCVLWHFVHDSYLGDGYFNWYNPFGKQAHTPSTRLRIWLKKTWAVPTTRSFVEIFSGTIALSLALTLAGYQTWVPHLIVLVLLGLGLIWGKEGISKARRS
jgi:hypothetical protein